MLLAYSSYQLRTPDEVRRHAVAQSSWRQGGWRVFPIADESLPRMFNEGQRRFPFIVDLFDAASLMRPDDEIVVFVNSDIGLTSDAAFKIAVALGRNPATYCFRRDAGHRVMEPPKDDEILLWTGYCGTDLFAFRCGWWRENRKRFPEMILGREGWDACLRVLVEATCPNKPVAVENICWHERHGGNGHWESGANRYTLPGQKQNLKLAKLFLQRFGHRPEAFGIR